jgi:NADH-quinone oxidoreductase subunit N
MTSANDLLVLFLGLEVLSIALYVLAASHRRRIQSQESGLKYFVLGGFSSAFFLYGVALVYGATGSTNIGRIVEFFATRVQTQRTDALVLAGVALLLVGLTFKVAAVPFHFWTPDVYQGAPTPVTSFMASVGKTAAFAAMLRVLVYALPQWSDDWRPAIWVIAVVTLVVGSTLAVVQTQAAVCRRRCCTCCSTRCSSSARSRWSPSSPVPVTARPTSVPSVASAARSRRWRWA